MTVLVRGSSLNCNLWNIGLKIAGAGLMFLSQWSCCPQHLPCYLSCTITTIPRNGVLSYCQIQLIASCETRAFRSRMLASCTVIRLFISFTLHLKIRSIVGGYVTPWEVAGRLLVRSLNCTLQKLVLQACTRQSHVAPRGALSSNLVLLVI